MAGSFGLSIDSRYLQFCEWDNRKRADVEAFIKIFIEQQQQLPRIKFQLAVVLKSEDKLIGNGGIRKQNIESNQAELGYEISPDYWGKGYATEAASTILKFRFEDFKLYQFTRAVSLKNMASRRDLQKIGMKFKRKLPKTNFLKIVIRILWNLKF